MSQAEKLYERGQMAELCNYACRLEMDCRRLVMERDMYVLENARLVKDLKEIKSHEDGVPFMQVAESWHKSMEGIIEFQKMLHHTLQNLKQNKT